MIIKIGQGIDTHKLETGLPLIIGGVEIPFKKGSKGHSDGDVLFHAIIDAILGASSLGDIGKFFPSTDNQWKGVDSAELLKKIFNLILKKGFYIANIDSTILLQVPHINPYIKEMRQNISSILKIPINCVSVKATTTDHLGYIGKGKGISAQAIVLLNTKLINNG